MNKILGGLALFFFLLAVSVVVFNLGVHTTKASEWVGAWESRDAEVFRDLSGNGADRCSPAVQEKSMASVNAFIWHTNQMFADPNATVADFRKVLPSFSVAEEFAGKTKECLGWAGHAEKLAVLRQKINERL